jgi:hypothetical protein
VMAGLTAGATAGITTGVAHTHYGGRFTIIMPTLRRLFHNSYQVIIPSYHQETGFSDFVFR